MTEETSKIKINVNLTHGSILLQVAQVPVTFSFNGELILLASAVNDIATETV